MSEISDKILDNIDIVDIIGRYVNLKRAGSNFSGLCPFHNEKTPSFMVSPQKQIFKCFGCGIGGNVIAFIKEIERIDFWDAVKILAKDANIDIQEYEKNPKFYEKYSGEKEKIKYIHKITEDFFKNSLKNSDLAQDYLYKKRNLSHELVEKFGLGYAPNNHYELIQLLKSKGFDKNDIVKSSIAKESQNGDFYSFFKNRITFPIQDTMNNIVAFSARILDSKDKPKYLNSSENIVFVKSKILYGLNFAKSNIKEFEKLIIVEGQMDVIALHRLGFPIGVATCGTALTDEHIKLIKRYTDNIYLLFDNDGAGREATIRALKVAYKYDIFPKIIRLQGNVKDVDDIANLEQGKEIFESNLNKAKDGFLTILEELRLSMDMNSPVDKQKLFNILFSIIIGLPNPSTQIHYLNVLSDQMGQNYEIINVQFKQYAKGEGRFFLKQQKNKEVSKLYQPDRNIIVASLFYQSFYKEYLQDEENIQKITNILETIQKIGFKLKFIEELESQDENIINQLKEAQLRREKEFNLMTDEESKNMMIKKVLQPVLKNSIQQITKLSNINTKEKQLFLESVRFFLK